MNQPEIVICNPKRTAVGRYGGAFVGVPVQELAATVVTEVIKEAGIEGSLIDDIILGQASPNGAAPALGRVVALDAELGVDVPGMQLDRRCGSGLQAVATAAAHIASGAADLIIAGGAESMSNTEYTVDGKIRWGAKGGTMEFKDRLQEGREQAGGKHHPIPGGMIETAENLRDEYSIARDRQDQLAVNSHKRAAAAQEAGKFDEEIVPVSVPQRKGDPIVVDKDEHIRLNTSTESLAKLRPIMGKKLDGATVTAGNASGQNDGAAAMIVTTREKAEELGLTPSAVLRGWAVAGVAPETMGIGPVAATEKLFDRLGKGADGRFSVCRVRIHRLRQLGRDPGHRIGIIGQVKAVRGDDQTVEPGIIVKRPGVCCRVVDNAECLVGVAKKDAIVGSLRVAQDC